MAATEIAHAKLNLALHVRAREPDGYHRIETLFAFCDDGDRVVLGEEGEPTLRIVGTFAEGLSDGPDNLVRRAAEAFGAAFGVSVPPLMLDKRLPVAAGIGGGSADAAAVLRLLAATHGIDPGEKRLTAIAASLGADVPACLMSRPVRGEGRGDALTDAAALVPAGAPVLLVNPRVPLATGPVFAGWDGCDRGALDDDWRGGRNDLEAPAIMLVPEIGEVLGWLRAAPGADFARMSGSGATCFALFADARDRDAVAAALPGGWWRLATQLRT